MVSSLENVAALVGTAPAVVVVLKVPDAPEPGPTNVTTPPATGSPVVIGVTVVTNELPYAVLVIAFWLPPDVALILKPAD